MLGEFLVGCPGGRNGAGIDIPVVCCQDRSRISGGELDSDVGADRERLGALGVAADKSVFVCSEFIDFVVVCQRGDSGLHKLTIAIKIECIVSVGGFRAFNIGRKKPVSFKSSRTKSFERRFRFEEVNSVGRRCRETVTFHIDCGGLANGDRMCFGSLKNINPIGIVMTGLNRDGFVQSNLDFFTGFDTCNHIGRDCLTIGQHSVNHYPNSHAGHGLFAEYGLDSGNFAAYVGNKVR